MEKKFSQRIGLTATNKPIQLKSIDHDLRNSLWNAVSIAIMNRCKDSYGDFSNYQIRNLTAELWISFYKLPVDEILYRASDNIREIRNRFFQHEWYEVYDLLEFLASLDGHPFSPEEFMEVCNEFLEVENSAFRFINGILVPISNEHELDELEEALEVTGDWTALNGANIHLQNSLEKISDKKNPDYRNSIKESISAVESVANAITGGKKSSLGQALTAIKDKISLHTALENGFKKIYGYTSDADGIRHSLMEQPSCDFEDAKYMLVSCSSFINYIVQKAARNGIDLN